MRSYRRECRKMANENVKYAGAPTWIVIPVKAKKSNFKRQSRT